MNFLIVDDDPSICAGTIRRLRNMDLPQIERLECAYSGEEALEWMARARFDALLTDIRMGGMDGLELIAQARKLLPDLICLIVTAYDDFDYAKRAIPLGVVDFLVKPCSEADMERQVASILVRYERLRQERALKLERALCQESEESVQACFERLGVQLPAGKLRVAVWEHMHCALPQPAEGLELVAPAGRNFALTAAEDIEPLMMWARTLVAGSGQSVGLSERGEVFSEMHAQAVRALNARWFVRDPQICLYDDAPLDAGLSQALVRAVRGLQNEELAHLLSGLLSRKGLTCALADRYMALCLEEIRRIESLLGLREAPLAPLAPYGGWQAAVEVLRGRITCLTAAQSDESYRVLCAKQYVREHLYEPIDMAVVANLLDLSYAYFSRIFRNETGKTFTGYLLECRLEETCRLLLRGERLVDIAVKLGYQNAGNLTRAFTRQYGLSPSQWLKMHNMP